MTEIPEAVVQLPEQLVTLHLYTHGIKQHAILTVIAQKSFGLYNSFLFSYKLDFIHNVTQKTAKLCVCSIRHKCVEQTHGDVF